MKRKAFLLGIYATGSQVLLLRELVSSLNGDELIIGTALFGWLLWVAIGASLGGRKPLQYTTTRLFIGAALLLPVMIVVTRLLPLLVTDIVGELIPFTSAALISVVVTLPTGIISGWLFPAVAREGAVTTDSIITVYLWEGIGAFFAGGVVVLLTGTVLSTFETSVAVGLLVVLHLLFATDARLSIPVKSFWGIFGSGLLVVVIFTNLDISFDGWKYESYRVEDSFDTPYSHQTILVRDSSVILLTDNTVEAIYPDQETNENLLIPSLVYAPEGELEVLLVGRTEFGVAQLARSLPDLNISAVDPRGRLVGAVDRIVPSSGVFRIQSDPSRFTARPAGLDKYDIVILNTGEPNSYRTSRMITGEFLATLKPLMKKNSLFGEDCRPYLMAPAESVDIDTLQDVAYATFLLQCGQADEFGSEHQ